MGKKKPKQRGRANSAKGKGSPQNSKKKGPKRSPSAKKEFKDKREKYKNSQRRSGERNGEKKDKKRPAKAKSSSGGRKSGRDVGIFTKIRRKLFPKPAKVKLDAATQRIANESCLTNENLSQLKSCFQNVDEDESGEIDYNEFFDFIDEKKSPFSAAVFELFDEDKSGAVDYNEFVKVCANYCMYSKLDILKFCYETFDKDGSGTIDEEEFMDLCVTVNAANPTFPGSFMTALEEFDQNDDGLIDFEEFQIINQRYPLVLFPAFKLQDRMQEMTLGHNGWADAMRRCTKRKFLKEYMETHDGELPPEPLCDRIRNALKGTGPHGGMAKSLQKQHKRSSKKKKKGKAKKDKAKKKKKNENKEAAASKDNTP